MKALSSILRWPSLLHVHKKNIILPYLRKCENFSSSNGKPQLHFRSYHVDFLSSSRFCPSKHHNKLTKTGGFYQQQTDTNLLVLQRMRHIQGLMGCRPFSSAVLDTGQTSQDRVNFSKISNIQKDGSILTTKRIVRRRKNKDSPLRDQTVYDVIAFATSDKYNLKSLQKDLIQQGLYTLVDLPSDILEEGIHVEAMYGIEDESRCIFFYKDGSVVFWNMPDVERTSVLNFLRRHQEGSYSKDLVTEEFEHIEYAYTSGNTKLQGDEIYLSNRKQDDALALSLEKYSFSNALALSVKLAIWEALLDHYVESIEYVLQDLQDGKKIKLSETDVLRKAGWLLNLRHLINLRSDLLDTPDPYWDREEIGQLYNKTYSHLDIARRTKVMNEKLSHCCELTNMLQELLKDKHHTRLEWMIIILIMIEVVFEIFHTYERRFSGSEDR